MDEANSPTPSKGWGEPGNVKGIMKYLIPHKRTGSELHTSEIEPRIPVLIDNIDTVLPPASTEIAARAAGWDEPGDVRGVIKYLPPKHEISSELHTSDIEGMPPEVFGHPVMILSMGWTEDTETVHICPSLEPVDLVRQIVNQYGSVQITSRGGSGPCKRPGVLRYSHCMDILSQPDQTRKQTKNSLFLESGRANLQKPSGVNVKKVYTVPHQSLKYWRSARTLMSSPRLIWSSYIDMMNVVDKQWNIRNFSWRGRRTASDTEMDSLEELIQTSANTPTTSSWTNEDIDRTIARLWLLADQLDEQSIQELRGHEGNNRFDVLTEDISDMG